MELLRVCGIAFLGVSLSLAVHTMFPTLGKTISLATAVVMAVVVAQRILPLLEDYMMIAETTAVSGNWLSVLIKTLGLSYLTVFCADTCRDFGHTAVAEQVELVGKISMLVLALPFVKDFLSIIRDMMI